MNEKLMKSEKEFAFDFDTEFYKNKKAIEKANKMIDESDLSVFEKSMIQIMFLPNLNVSKDDEERFKNLMNIRMCIESKNIKVK